jgi:hypothetical protein
MLDAAGREHDASVVIVHGIIVGEAGAALANAISRTSSKEPP